MSRPRFSPIVLPETVRPAPTYPEYAQLLADAQVSLAEDGQFVDPRKLAALQRLHRGWEWQVCVLGHEYTGREYLDVHLLLLADERNLDPPLPQWLVEQRAADAAEQAERDAAKQQWWDARQAAWDDARKDCPVDVTVLRNGKARPYQGQSHYLGHVVPAVDVLSGSERRPRLHQADRALCERVSRARPLDLSGGEGGPATCVNCLRLTPLIRPAK